MAQHPQAYVPEHGSSTPARASDVSEEASDDVRGEVPGDLAALRAAVKAWREGPVAKSIAKVPLRKPRFSTWSDREVPDLRTPADVAINYQHDLGLPGEYPFTRG